MDRGLMPPSITMATGEKDYSNGIVNPIMGELSAQIHELQFMEGDFNEVIYPWERSNGSGTRGNQGRRFKACLDDYDISDVGFKCWLLVFEF